MRLDRSLVSVLLVVAASIVSVGKADDALRDEAARTLARAKDFFVGNVASHGGYLWRYSEDLSKREGESRTEVDTAWVQPPGTPSIGMVWLDAFEATGDKQYLEAARQTGMCLVNGQLVSGGWDYRIEFDPKARQKYAYRVDQSGRDKRNVTTLDDNTTQHALRFLMRLDKTLASSDGKIHGAVDYALDSLIKAQYPNGAWPQRYDRFPDPLQFPVKKASYPENWSRIYPGADYREFYTFNDNAIADMIDVMFLAAKIYENKNYRAAAERAGGFILLAQMPDPQPAWAQQYDGNMQPAWARKFEPPAITGGESQGVLRTLLRLYEETGDKKYLAPIPPAIAYLKRSRLDDGGLARFYELKTNKPLYFTRGDYQLTHDDSNLPTHYGFKVGSKLDSIERDYERLLKTPPDELRPRTESPRASKSLENQVRVVIAAIDRGGRWVEPGALKYHGDGDSTRHVIDCRTFIANTGVLIRYLAAVER